MSDFCDIAFTPNSWGYKACKYVLNTEGGTSRCGKTEEKSTGPGLQIPEQPRPETAQVLPPGAPDPSIGKFGAETRRDLVQQKCDDNLSFEQIEAVLTELTKAPLNRVLDPNAYRYSSEQFNRLYPEIAKIRELDKSYNHKLFWYFRDFRSYWDNVTLLFSLYAQKIMESVGEDRDKKIASAFKMAIYLSQRIKYQKMCDQATHKKLGPSDYRLATFRLSFAELYSQTKNRNEHFYNQGIRLALWSLQTFLATEQKKIYPSKPDYFSIAKGIIILGDLYQQLAHLTLNEDRKYAYFERANYLYTRIAALDPKTQGMRVRIPVLNLKIAASPKKIEEALNFNKEQGHMTAKEIERSRVGLFNYLKGFAYIKRAGVFVAWPKLKTPEETVRYLLDLKMGKRLLATATNYLLMEKRAEVYKSSSLSAVLKAEQKIFEYAARLGKKNAFTTTLTRLIEGELLLMLADRISYYTIRGIESQAEKASKTETWKQAVDYANKIVKQFKGEPYYESLKNLSTFDINKRRKLADGLIRLVQKEYLKDISSDFKYLSAWAIVKLLEIAIRNADYVKPTGQGRVPDAVKEIAICKRNEKLLQEISKGRVRPEYLKIEFDYLRTILYLTGIALKNRNGTYRIKFDDSGARSTPRTTYPDKVFELVSQIEKDTKSLPSAPRAYFEIYTHLKEVGALLQIKGRSRAKNKKILQRIKQKTGKALSPTRYALKLLEDIEKRTAPVIPSYLWYNLTITLPRHLKSGNFSNAQQIIDVTKIFVNQKVKKYYPGTYQKVKAKLDQLEKQKSIAALKSLAAELMRLDASRNFKGKYSEELVWDLHTLHSELYHQMAIAYSILGRGKGKNAPENISLFQYAQSAYIESRRSSSPYDYKHRSFFIDHGTRIKADKSVPILKKTSK